LPALILVIAALIVGFFLYSRSKKGGGGNWVQFFAQGKDAGFSFKEIELLRQLAIKCNIGEPTALFWSQSQLDTCIRTLVQGIKSSGEEEQGIQDFLSKLYDYRKKIEMNKPKNKHGISNSRQIIEGQVLKVLAGAGVYKSQVVKNTSQYMTISRPVNNKNSTSSAWEGTKISVYFWRSDDAGYVFDTVVQDEIFSKGISSLKIQHSDSLFRTQKRKSIRIKMNKAAYLYIANDGEPPHQMEQEPGLKCFLIDLSETGCAVTVGGKTEPGMRVKVQFALDNSPICMTGIVRSTHYREDTNRSNLHIEAEALPIETRNKILGEVFGVMPEEDEELPYRVLDDEAANIGSQTANLTGASGDTGGTADGEITGDINSV
jgi:c-di-GMP-binding flagellar brake protein YcgR